MDETNKTIAIGKNKEAYEMPLNLIQLSAYLAYFIPNSKSELAHIFNLLDLDISMRKRYGNTINFKSDETERMSLWSFNKGLTLELFTGAMFGFIDHPTEVHSNCLVSHYRPGNIDSNDSNIEEPAIALPNHFAQGGVPDVQVDYDDFLVALEVSAKYQPSLEDFNEQLTGALDHARTIRKAGYDKPIYCILINQRSLKHTENKVAMKEVLEDIKKSERIYIAVISIDEFADLGKTMTEKYKDEITKVYSNDLHGVLKATIEKGIYGRFDEKYTECLENIKTPSTFF